MTRSIYLVLLLILLPAASALAQTKKITGTVRSAKDSSSLPAVSITIKGTNKGVITTTTGNYSITCAHEDILVFSSLGYTAMELPVGNRSELTVYLDPSDQNDLSEVVVTTALGIKKQQKAIGYAVQEVSGQSLEKTKTPTAMGALVGKVAGLKIANTTDLFRNPGIELRGKAPLIVIDGIPDPNADPYKVNADDIESITVLKGTAAGALYGQMGINGAILYTTKRGKKGVLSVDVNSSTMFQTGYTVVPKVQTQYGAGDAGKYAYIDGSGGGVEGAGWIWGPRLDQRDPNTPSGFVELPQYNSPYDPDQNYTVTFADGTTATSHYKPIPWVSKGSNNIKNFFRTGILSTNSVAASAGSDKGSYRVSANHIYQRGVVPNTEVNNSSFSIGGTYALTKQLNVDAKLTYNKEYSANYPTVGYGPPNILYNLLLWIGPDIDITDLKNYWVKGKEGLQQRNYNLSWYNNPYFVANELLNGYKKDNSFGQVTFDYQIGRDFSLKFRNGFNQYSEVSDLKEPYSYIAYSYISKGNYSVTNSTYFDIASDLILNYKHRFSDNFNINATAGGANTYRNFKSAFATTDGLSIPGLYNLNNSQNPLKGSNNLQERRTASLYATLDIETLKFLYFSFTGRYDKASTMPVDNNAYFYPSAGISAVLSDALKLPDFISFLKTRASWAKVNTGFIDKNDAYAHLLTYGIGPKWNNVPSLVWPNTYISADLIPSTVESGEYGLALGLLKNRINIDATFFRNKEYNGFTTVRQSLASGYSGLFQNADVYVRKGWEFVVSGSPVQNAAFRWETTLNFSNSHLWLKDATLNPEGFVGNIKEGDRTDRVFITNSQTPDGQAIYKSNGFESFDANPHFFGNSDAKWIYGWQNTFRYKDVSLSFSFDGRLGGLIYSTTNQKMWWGGTSPGTVNQYRDDANAGKATYVGPGVVVTEGEVTYDRRGQIISDTRKYAPNTTAVNYITFMQSTSGGMLNNYFFYEGTYLKMRELVLTYNLPANWIKRVFKSASVSLIGNNLFILSKLPNVDPDAERDDLQTPSMRSMGININLKF
ncbi:SusC/RagA family TonB-linked outer membrane protein [Niabella beijingensis]|uniref:SusC/RagA family TonB-linked outer membrane protein n=1 Tax=Niabella beijingensis TaxID=2872700 RepID=UPI001CBC4CDA|nr:SusC/RagA family TonB-linked outer membrane protein [Niabella beijingensis]MBZ4188691.1 SusC/RagA family TonB-linked outer membrane protein [Niabella beijingensis]